METTEWDEIAEGEIDFSCPRCHRDVIESYYGPCDECVTELRATQIRVAQDVEAKDYEPKMNVTPNAIATKD